MATPDYSGLSNQFREYYASLTPEIQDRFLTATQVTFGVKNRRNVELWVTQSGTRRNFINRNVSPLEMEMREAYVKGLINNVPPTTIQKESDFGINASRIGYKMRQYLAEDFTREACSSIGFLSDRTLYSYDADSSAFEDIDDDASAEFDEIPTDPEPPPETPTEEE